MGVSASDKGQENIYHIHNRVKVIAQPSSGSHNTTSGLDFLTRIFKPKIGKGLIRIIRLAIQFTSPQKSTPDCQNFDHFCVLLHKFHIC